MNYFVNVSVDTGDLFMHCTNERLIVVVFMIALVYKSKEGGVITMSRGKYQFHIQYIEDKILKIHLQCIFLNSDS